MDQNSIKNACVVVLGDIGRSPRMQYHVKSLSDHKYNVDIIGYVETDPMEAISKKPNIKIHKLIPFPNIILPTMLKYFFKTIWQTFSLMKALISIHRSQFLIVQNPPAIPTLFVCYFYCWFMHTKFIIDWHNYAHTILALNSSPRSIIVRLAMWIEKHFGSKANANFCVSEEMRDDLEYNWGIKAFVLYDRPGEQFRPVDLKSKHEFYMKLARNYKEFADTTSSNEEFVEETLFTAKRKDLTVEYRPERPGILISSTSWTPDEDFGVLLKALTYYEQSAEECDKFPNLICVITGKGPQKDDYVAKISQLEWKHVSIITPWLESEDYPKILASADLGVCLHWSSSGVDLPMKVVDMFGCGLPVCAINFKCLHELVMHEDNGFVFNTPQELADYIKNWFEDFPHNKEIEKLKARFSRNLEQFQSYRWTENWDNVVLPVLEQFHVQTQ